MKFRFIAIFIGVNLFWLVLGTLLLETGRFSNEDKIVYTTKTGECYHLSKCSSLSRSKYKTTVGDAHYDGYYACSRCNAPVLIEGDGFQFNLAHYLVLVPVCALLSNVGIIEILWFDHKRFGVLYILNLGISAGVSVLFDFLF